MRVQFLSDLDVRDVTPEADWKLLAPLKAAVLCDDGHVESVTVPEGFVTNFCSVPKAPVVFELYGDIAFKAGALHDYLYSTGDYPREWCDKVLREAIIACGYGQATADPMYAAVRKFGESHYHQK